MNIATANLNINHSSALAPDLNWSQVRETIRMLNLAVAQVTASMQEGDESVDTLGNSFTEMATAIKAMEKMAVDLPDDDESTLKQDLNDKCVNLSDKIQNAIVAFQFYDRITQRLSHVCNSLESLSELVANDERLFQPGEWSELQKQIRSKFTMESDRVMFDALMQGKTVEDVLAMNAQTESKIDNSDDIELF